MKFGKVGQVGLVSAIALSVATLFTACGTLNVGFLFVATNKQTPGQIEVYEVDSESGAIRRIPTSPFPSGGRDPIAEAVSPDFKNLYVVNEDDDNVTQFGIGTDGKLYPQSTINTPGSFPMAIAVNPGGTFAFTVQTLSPFAGCSLDNPCPGAVTAYPVTATTATSGPGSLGTAVAESNGLSYIPLELKSGDTTDILTPTAINVTSNGQNAYVSAYNATTNLGYIFAFSINSSGQLTELNGGVPYVSGVQPVAMVSDAGSANLYVADKTTDQVTTYAVGSGGSLSAATSTVNTGNQPSALTFDGSGKFLYVANSLDSTVTGYTVSSGTLTTIGTNASDANPIAIIADPRHVGYLYTVNFLGSSLSGFQIDPNTGTLINAQNTPYVSFVQPTAVAGIPHGGTATK
jgi:6-phosphogluconolactonase (cycloisomerase 2 family)